MSTDRLFEMRYPDVELPPEGEAFPPPHAALSVGDTAVDIDGRVVTIKKIHIDGSVSAKSQEDNSSLYRISPQFLKLVSKAPKIVSDYDKLLTLYNTSQSRNKFLESVVNEIEEEIHNLYSAKYTLEYRHEMEDSLKHGDLPIRERVWLTKHIETVGDD